MNTEVVRRQYLDAMGITAWASRYRLPNALETPACEWEDTTPTPVSPSQRLHTLLDDAQQAEQARKKVSPSTSSASSPASVRALLDDSPVNSAPGTPSEAPPSSLSPAHTATTESTEASREPVTFTLSCFCLAGRWLSLHAGQLSAQEQSLLANLYRAVGVTFSHPLQRVTFNWPPMADAPAPEEPLEEAREGLHAFINGVAGRNGWALERVLWWGDAEAYPFGEVLAIAEGQSRTLELPVWQGPRLATLLDSADAKRALLPSLLALARQW
ncbi:hypothetical protein QC823_02070 [Halomonas vilamensis]|uniref:Uncharacterized protein n=1 Tax=Vreelandella vilamensis TaxID=531309 RepID=A0ABU1H0E7_9GAMM|nr:hypothetical protein [Halomonas vilamensis]MDR5897785.1 hypothetical protein [Halomonas vilamensis]